MATNKSQASTNASQTAKAGLHTGNKPSHRSEVPPNFNGVVIKHAPLNLAGGKITHPEPKPFQRRTTNPTREELVALSRRKRS